MTLDTRPAAPAAPVETVTPIKPSEALRLGRLQRPRHCIGFLQRGEDGACALGAMHYGWGMKPDDDETLSDDFVHRFGGLPIHTDDIASLFDGTEIDGRDGDAAVLAYLEERGL